jgi:PRTRC genetic system ThiF family protein
MSKTDFDLNWDYLRASKVMLKDSDTVNLVLVGCGGTGSWLAPAVARVGRLLRDSRGLDVRINFVDPDLVEEKNVYRQNFSNAEIGESKAFALAFRYGLSWGMPIVANPRRLAEGKRWLPGGYEQTTVFLGCVDRASARQEIRDSMVGGDWWIDCGNEADNGQVLIGCKGEMPKEPFKLPGYCSWLPLPSLQHPELLQGSEQSHSDLGLSCAELALRDSQGMAINQRMAAEAADYLVRLLITRDLQKMATYIDLASGVSRSTYITQQAVFP